MNWVMMAGDKLHLPRLNDLVAANDEVVVFHIFKVLGAPLVREPLIESTT